MVDLIVQSIVKEQLIDQNISSDFYDVRSFILDYVEFAVDVAILLLKFVALAESSETVAEELQHPAVC